VNFANYLKTAFVNHWNLLFFLGGSALALLSGHTDVVLPVVLAGELTYLGLLASHPKFQSYVDAQRAKLLRSEGTQEAQATLQRILHTLPRDLVERFDKLRSQCLELRQIANELKHPAPQGIDQPLEASQAAGLDRLLWIYLRLLYTQFALGKFLQKTPEKDIQQDLQRLQLQLAQSPLDEKNVQAQRIRKTMEDNLETCRARLANLGKARDNYQLIDAQLDQLENKIRSLSEMAVNRQEPEFISNQVDQVASSMVQTEQTMNELRFATGLEAISDDTPELLSAKKIPLRQG
jgi:hypothetical protein